MNGKQILCEALMHLGEVGKEANKVRTNKCCSTVANKPMSSMQMHALSSRVDRSETAAKRFVRTPQSRMHRGVLKALEIMDDPSQKARHMDLFASDVARMPRRRTDRWYNLTQMAFSVRPMVLNCAWPRMECRRTACTAAHLCSPYA
jgi:hypothetical protein